MTGTQWLINIVKTQTKTFGGFYSNTNFTQNIIDTTWDHFNIQKLSDLPTIDELSAAGLIDSSSVNPNIFGTGKFFKEQTVKNKDTIYSDIDKTLDETQKTDK